ncbi:ABC transporter ATP-binding protein [Microbispora sp. H10830]|uniref:ABC transporter ATP-binding protein n=1 Tax=Microbispora sp. H10830 TaxID=2729109 RepID=UPI0016033845|nr:ABC transporter ATP-binding protein [Microbispora sp. H10830]
MKTVVPRGRGRGRSSRSDTGDSPRSGPAGLRPAEAAGPALRTVGLTRVYGEDESLVWAVDGVDLDVPAGQTLAVTGPSGCGKSTLLQLLGGLDRPSEGEVWLGGLRIDHLGERALARLRRRSVGFVFQAYHLMHELSAAQNVELPALLAGASPRAARRRAAELLQQVGLAGRARHLPSELSGGQRQRVAVARALANDPLVVLADEPTGNLDSAATHDILRLFDELRAAGQTLVMVTHDERVAATADRVVSMRDGTLADDTRLDGDGRGTRHTHGHGGGRGGDTGLGGGTGLGALLRWED